MTNDYETVFDFCIKCGYTEEIIKENLSTDGKVWDSFFSCVGNELISLEGAPKQINGSFACDYNKLTSLKGCPKIVNGNFYCSNNELISLKETPKFINGNIHL